MNKSLRAFMANEIQRLDRIAITKFGIPSVVLMENAGRGVAEAVLKVVKKGRVVIVCGSGNNGGDGLVAGRHLLNHGIAVHIFLAGNAQKLSKDTKINYRILKKLKYPIMNVAACDHTRLQDIKKADVVVDAIFGVGLNRVIEGSIFSWIKAINTNAKRIVSVDVPSGLDATTGKIHGICVRADQTITFSFPKTGFLKREGPRMTGKVIVVDIGIPKKIYDRHQ